MKNSFLKIAQRFLWRNRSYSILNFLCLSFGLTCAIIAVLYIMNIFSFDRFHKNYKRLYQVESMVTYFNGARFAKEPQSASLSEVLLKNVPEIESLSRVVDCNNTIINGDKSFDEKGIYADSNFFDMFSFTVKSKSSPGILSEQGSIVISERTALRLFQTTDCLGKMIVLQDGEKRDVCNISGVISDVPAESSLQFDYVLPLSKYLAENSWASETGASVVNIWVMPGSNSDAAGISRKIKDLIKKQETTLNQELFLFPLSEKVLYSYSGDRRVWKMMQTVVIVGSIGFAILLIACFNFINLAVAQNIRRYREVGIKKVAGATKQAIVLQFLGETFIIVALSLITAILFVRLLLTGFNTLSHGNINLSMNNLMVIPVFIGIALITALISGLLPSLYLASFKPVSVLKGRIITGNSFGILRQSLIIFQFAIPIVLIICMMIIKIQDRYIRNFDLGFDREKLIILNNTLNLETHGESLKADLLSIPGIESVSFTNCVPTRGARVSNEVNWEGKDNSEKLHFWCVNADHDYNRTIQIKMTEGRYFDKAFSADSNCYVINDITAQVMKNKNPVGSSLTLEGKRGTIIGVFKDFHTVDLRGPYTPMIISLNPMGRNTLLIRYSTGNFKSVSTKIAEVYRKYESGVAFQPVVFNDLPDFVGLQATSNLVGLAFVIAMILACMGLSGLAAYTAEKRTKEIGIRKINGATTLSVMKMLLRNYTNWLTIAFLIAVPVSLVIGRIFLSGFFFRTAMPVVAFITGPVIAFLAALLTVSWQSWRAASKNPVESLKYE